MKNIRAIVTTKKFIYFIRLIGWLDLLVAIYISLFHMEVLDKYPLLSLIFALVSSFSGYKVNYEDMKISKRIFIILITIILFLIYGYVNYLINFK